MDNKRFTFFISIIPATLRYKINRKTNNICKIFIQTI